MAGNVCEEVNFAVCSFGGNLQTLHLLNLLAHVIVVKRQPYVSATLLFRTVPSLMPEALRKANKRVASLSREVSEAGPALNHAKKTYSSYFAEDRACIGRYAAEYRPTKALQHFTVPESTAHLLKKQHLAEFK